MILLLLLMTINAATFVTKGYKESLERHQQRTAGSLKSLRNRCNRIYDLASTGPGRLYKSPSPLAFCAHGEEENIPRMVSSRNSGYGYGFGPEDFLVSGLYIHFSSDPNLRNIMPHYLKIDWVFIIGVVVSFACILFTFDSISGEKERGTLRLVLAGSVSRSSLVLGKFVGALVSVILPLSIAILLNLLIINVSGTIQLDVGHWTRIGMMALISAFYITCFICLGMLVSTCCSRSRTSLLILLLIWVVLVVLMPSILGSMSSGLREVPSVDELSRQKEATKQDIHKTYHDDRGLAQMWPSRQNPDMKAMNLWAEYLNAGRGAVERLEDEHLDAQLAQIQLARQITRISPTAIYRYALERMSNTGFERHREFIANVRAYRDKFWEYIRSEDQRDPDSLHVYFVIPSGLSGRPANSANAPRFTESLTLAGSLQSVLIDAATLSLFAALFFMASYISFIRTDVR